MERTEAETKVMVELNTVDAVKEFTTTISRYPVEAELTSGRYTIDAKSIMGIFSLDLSKPIELHVFCDTESVTLELLEDISTYLS